MANRQFTFKKQSDALRLIAHVQANIVGLRITEVRPTETGGFTVMFSSKNDSAINALLGIGSAGRLNPRAYWKKAFPPGQVPAEMEAYYPPGQAQAKMEAY